MSALTKYAILIFLMLSLVHDTIAQTTTTQSTTIAKTKTTTSTTKKKKPVKKSVTTVLGKPVALTINNLADGAVPVYVGPKEGLKKPKVTTLGGMSKNAMTLKVNEVVCILSSDGKKAIACTNVKSTTKVIELSSSGTMISSK